MSVSLQIWTLTDCFPVYSNISADVYKKKYNLTFLQQFFKTEELEPICVIHNISIATSDDVTYFGDDVKYISFIFTQGNYHLGTLS